LPAAAAAMVFCVSGGNTGKLAGRYCSQRGEDSQATAMRIQASRERKQT
jgi:hypothetical protein